MSENSEKLKRPVMAFVIFVDSKTQQRCVKEFRTWKDWLLRPVFHEKCFKLFGECVQLREGTEATNLIWENLHI